MNGNIKYLLLLLLIFISGIVRSQGAGTADDPPLDGAGNGQSVFRISAASYYDGSKIHIRWRPMDINTLMYGIQHGYTLTRMTIETKGEELKTEDMLQTKVNLIEKILPETEQYWNNLNHNDLVGLGKKILFENALEIQNLGSLTPKEALNKARDQKNIYSMAMWTADASLDIAKGFGFYFEDNNFDANSKYFYIISLVDKGDSKIEGATTTSSTYSVKTWPPPGDIGYARDKKHIRIKWKLIDKQLPYSYYDLERSSNNGQSFQKVNNKPIVSFADKSSKDYHEGFMYCIDSVPEYKHMYVYRLRGYTPFDTPGPYSDTIHAMAWPDPIIAPIHMDSIDQSKDDRLRVYWQMPSSYNDSVLGFRLMRAKSEDSRYNYVDTSWMASSVRSFLDLHPYSVNYYVLEYKDINSNIIRTEYKVGQPLDTIPPIATQHVNCTVNNEGLAHISWNPSSSEDAAGYKVFYSNTENGMYTQLTKDGLKDTSFYYSPNLNILNDYVYFKILVYDFRDNRSNYSAACALKRPDILPPASPVIISYEQKHGGVSFKWNLSTSTDVVRHVFQRRAANEAQWLDLISFPTQQPITEYYDTLGDVGKLYSYRLIAIDDANLKSSSKVLKLKALRNGFYPAPVFVGTASNVVDTFFYKSNKQIKLNFYYKNYEDLEGFEVYRQLDTLPYRSYKYLRMDKLDKWDYSFVQLGNQNGIIHFKYTDFTVAYNYGKQTIGGYAGGIYSNTGPGSFSPPAFIPKHTYKYKIVAKFIDGSESLVSSEIEVIIQ